MKKHKTISGRWELIKQNRATGEIDEVVSLGKNSITTDGKTEAVKLMWGLGGTPFSNGNAELKLYDNTLTLIKTVACDATYPSHSYKSVVFKFSDISVDQYTVEWLYFGNGVITFSTKQQDSSIFPAPENNVKPNTQNWIYQYTLSISDSDADMDDDGEDQILRIITGDQSLDFGSADLHVAASGGTPESSVNMDATYPQLSGTTVTCVFTSAPGSNSQQWYTCWVSANLDGGTYVISSTVEDAGTKGAADQWVYTYEFHF